MPAIFAGVVFVSLSAILVRISTAPALTIAFYRMLFSVGMLLPFALRSGFRGIGTRDAWLTVASGVFLGIHFAAWISSIQHTSVAHSTVLVTMHPVLVVTIESVRRRRLPEAKVLLAVAVSLIGAIVLSTGGSSGGVPVTAYGDALAVLGAVAVTGYILLGRHVRARVPAGTYNFVVYAVAALVLLPPALVRNEVFGSWTVQDYGVFLSLAFFCTLLGHSVLNWSLRFVPAAFVSMSILMEPVFASVLAFLVFREQPGVVSLAGAVLVIAGLAVLHEKRDSGKP